MGGPARSSAAATSNDAGPGSKRSQDDAQDSSRARGRAIQAGRPTAPRPSLRAFAVQAVLADVPHSLLTDPGENAAGGGLEGEKASAGGGASSSRRFATVSSSSAMRLRKSSVASKDWRAASVEYRSAAATPEASLEGGAADPRTSVHRYR